MDANPYFFTNNLRNFPVSTLRLYHVSHHCQSRDSQALGNFPQNISPSFKTIRQRSTKSNNPITPWLSQNVKVRMKPLSHLENSMPITTREPNKHRHIPCMPKLVRKSYETRYLQLIPLQLLHPTLPCLTFSSLYFLVLS